MKISVRVTNFMDAYRASGVLDRPFIFYQSESQCWSIVASASRHRNIRAENFCKRRNAAIKQEASNAAPQQTSLL